MTFAIKQIDILSQAQLHKIWSDLDNSAGVNSYSNGSAVFFYQGNTYEEWMKQIESLGFVHTSYRTYPGFNKSINTFPDLLQVFYKEFYAIYDSSVLSGYLNGLQALQRLK